jgi:16S rRNA (guanine966-N2)-methyltransferase
MKKQKSNKSDLKVKIIAGLWKGRNISFPDKKDLRPTKGLVRETLFNWLKNDIQNSYCLDLFSGSGALGFEAASRGAKKVYMIDSDLDVVHYLNLQKNKLNANNILIFNSDARQFLKDFNEKIDLIFLDPPFSKNIINELVNDISKLNSINDRCKIYIEIPSKGNFESSIIKPRNWELLKCKKSGGVAYLLFQHNCSMI